MDNPVRKTLRSALPKCFSTLFTYYGLFLVIVPILLFISPSQSYSETVYLDEHTESIALGPRVKILEDSEKTFTVSDLISDTGAHQWSLSPTDNLNLGYTNSAYWIKSELVNHSSGNLKFLFEIGYPVLDHVRVYMIRSDRQQEWIMGDKLPFQDRPSRHLTFVCPFTLYPSETVTILARIETKSSMQIPLYIYSPESFVEKEQVKMMLQGLYFGAMTVMALYNFFLFLSIRESDYLYYVLYVLSQCVFLASINGLSFQYLWPTMTRWNDQVIVVSLSSMIFFGSISTVSFLKLKQSHWKSYVVLVISAISAAAIIALSFFIPYKAGIFSAIFLAVFVFIFGIPVAITRWLKGFSPGRFFALAWMSLAGGVVFFILNKTGIIPRNFISENIVQICSVLLVMLLSIALADRLNMEKKEKIDAQHKAHAEERNARIASENAIVNERLAREAKEASFMIQKKATDSLEQEVLERTRQLNETLVNVSNANYQIMSSLRFASMIQRSMLPDPEKIKTWLPRHGIWWAPRDIVGGDFYFVDQIPGGYIVVVGDCTGQGIPGAFMTLIASSELKRIVKGDCCIDPPEILTRLNHRIGKALKQDVKNALTFKSLDIGVCMINVEKKQIEFSGARIDLICVKQGELLTLKGDKRSVSCIVGDNSVYSVQTIDIDQGMNVYLCTDGITDQLGELSGQRFGTRRLKDLLLEHSKLSIDLQCDIIKASVAAYRGERDQMDDMTMVAIEIGDHAAPVLFNGKGAAG
ncbi:MAG: SpoIIE family protein phosphatase [Proteobacteria bacterium]|nr:SpoIIE family protein phosphatase [Pseudomonadota bacterium]